MRWLLLVLCVLAAGCAGEKTVDQTDQHKIDSLQNMCESYETMLSELDIDPDRYVVVKKQYFFIDRDWVIHKDLRDHKNVRVRDVVCLGKDSITYAEYLCGQCLTAEEMYDLQRYLFKWSR